jgi:molybdate transport system substrate-binding protein
MARIGAIPGKNRIIRMYARSDSGRRVGAGSLAVTVASAVRVVSSMATRRLLAELIARFETSSPQRVALESVGGVDASRRVMAGEPFDVVILARHSIDELTAAGRIVTGSAVDIALSPVAVAVRAGAAHPDIGTAESVEQAVLAARTVGYSTGPSGVHLAKLFARWGGDELKARTVVAPPGVPVASLVARGEVELGFQQLSELLGVDGIDVVGLLPDAIQAITTFSGGIAQASAQPEAARKLLHYMAGLDTVEIKRRFGMEAA